MAIEWFTVSFLDLDSRAMSDDANADDNKQMNHVFKKLKICAKIWRGKKQIYFSYI